MKVLLFANTDWYLYNFRLSLATALRERGDEVILCSPPGRYVSLIQESGFRWHPFPLDRGGMNPLNELVTIWRLTRLFKKINPRVVHLFTIKPVLYGSIAAKLAGVPNAINAVTGLGHVFVDKKISTRIILVIVKILYRFGLKNTTVIFQNQDDRDLFIKLGMVEPGQTHMIPGSGVNLERFMLQPEPDGIPVVVLPGRLLKSKGVEEFVGSAQQIKKTGLLARFVLVGDTDFNNPASVLPSDLEVWQKEGSVEWWGWRDDMPNVFAQSNIICLPSYREGLSFVLLEAAASGRALVATDVPGCRDIVHHNENGLLVTAQNIPELTSALTTLIKQPDLRKKMALRGREIVEENYSVQIIVNKTLNLYPNNEDI